MTQLSGPIRTIVAVIVTAGLATTGLTSSAAGSTTPSPRITSDDSPPPIDITRLAEGAPSRVPWLFDGTIHAGENTTPVEAENVGSFSAVTGGYIVHTRTASAAGIELVRPNGHRIELDDGDISAPIVRRGGKEIAWARYEPADGQIASQVVAAYAPKGTVEPTTSGPVAASRYQPVGYLGALGVTLDSEGDDPASAVDVGTLNHLSWADTIGVSATSDDARLAAFVRRYDSSGRPCTTTARVDGLFGDTEDLWASCRIMPISFSPNGKYALAIDARSDGLGYSMLYVVRADTGKQIARLNVELTQRVAWESNRTLVFDAWNHRSMALVRCSIKGSDCERTTPIAADDPADGTPSFLLAQR